MALLRVLVTPGAERLPGAMDVARRLAGEAASVEISSSYGVRTLRRELSQAEVNSLRRALLGLRPGDALRPRPAGETVVGLVFAGKPAPGSAWPSDTGGGSTTQTGGGPLAVADHANLTWRSPLRGPNDESLGPRFPALAGLYRPGIVRERLPEVAGEEVVASVGDVARLTNLEGEIVTRHGFAVLTNELAPVAIAAAHLGYGLAAVALEQGEDT